LLVWHSDTKRNLILSGQRRNIEILKIRFGEAALQVCEVMLKDMTDSRRVDEHVQAQNSVRFSSPSFAIIELFFLLPSLFFIQPSSPGTFGPVLILVIWPCPNASKSLFLFWYLGSLLKCQVFRLQVEYAKEFSSFKPDKKLRWIPHLGTVELELHLEDRVVSATVPPLEAAFAELFSEKGVSLCWP
jgi:anaphase-promoting complex subunit 2